MRAKDQPLIDQQLGVRQPITECQEANDRECNRKTKNRNADVETDDATGDNRKACENRWNQIRMYTIGNFENQGQCMQAPLIFQSA